MQQNANQADTISNDPAAALPTAQDANRSPTSPPRRPGRPGRVIALVLFIIVVNGFDLVLTILAHRIGSFEEANPIARAFVHHTGATVALKIAAVVLASVIFVVYRRRRLTELACWLFAAIYLLLSVSWMRYYQYLNQ